LIDISSSSSMLVEEMR